MRELLVDRLRSLADCDSRAGEPLGKCMREAADEIDRLQRIIDSRPAINAGLPETYIIWSQSIYAMEISNAWDPKQ